MKSCLLIPLLALTATLAHADDLFPGLRNVMSDAEWKRAGLDKLTPDQLGVVDAALIKHYRQALAAALRTGSDSAASAPASPAPDATPAQAAAAHSRFWEKFGLGKSANTPDWRTVPPMIVTVTAWRGANGFVLDNGQVWEGIEKIPYDLPGNTVTIEARPLDSFALKLNDNSAAVRVRRVK